MKKLLWLSAVFFALASQAQTFYFHANAYKDSLSLVKSMPDLAKQAIPFYKEKDRTTYFDNIYRMQLVAEDYKGAMENLDSLRQQLILSDPASAKAAGFAYQTFAEAKMLQLKKQIPFDSAYRQTFPVLLNALSEKDMARATPSFQFDLKQLHDELYTLLQNQKGKDSISVSDARQLCRAYNFYNVYTQVDPIARPIVEAQDNKKFIVEDSLLITTRDGASLAVTLVRKKDVQVRQPAIFVFNIYNNPRDKGIAKEAAINGYVGIVANTRGKRLSPQKIEPFEHDANDAYDIIDWISKQPWSNGKVGMYGGSYLGFAQWAAAKKVHPALKTIIPQVAVGIGVDYPMTNNVFMSYMLRWIHYVTNSKETDEGDFNNDKHWDSAFTKWYVRGGSFRSLDSIEGRPNDIFQRWLMHPSQDAYWQHMVAYKTDFSKIDIPVLTTTGYFDADQLGAMYYFKQHLFYNKNAQHYLVIGPYDHAGGQGYVKSSVRGYTIDPVANISINDLAYRWFDFILKDSARPALLKDKINYEVMGTNEWKHAPALSAINNDTLLFYLSDTRVAQHYKMDLQPPGTTEFIRQEIDFKDRTDTSQIVENLIDSTINVANGLSFISQPFDKSFEINGSFLGELKMAINKRDMDIGITLYELMPDGKYFSLASYIGRASFAKNREQRQLLQPDRIESIPLNNSFFISKKIEKGSRLVIVLGIIKNSDWQINYGTGKDVSDETIADAKIPLEIKWYTNSVIKIPVQK